MVISEELKKTYSSVGPSVILETLELGHHTFPNSFFIVRDHADFQANLENSGPLITFRAFAFDVVQPKVSDRGSQTFQITIDNVSRDLVRLIEGAQDGSSTPIELKYRIYLNTDTAGPQNDPPLSLSLFNISVGDLSISGTASKDDLLNKKFPSELYERRFQSLFINQ